MVPAFVLIRAAVLCYSRAQPAIPEGKVLLLRRLEAHEINRVLGQNYDVWSPGLDRSAYKHYQWWQLLSSWGSRNISYFGLFSAADNLLASCKFYTLEYSARGCSLKVAGVGAVFVPDNLRGHSYGLKLLDAIAGQSAADGYEALLLNSDIDPEYYEKIGYRPFEAKTFSVQLSPAFLNQSRTYVEKMAEPELDEMFTIGSVEDTDIYEMCRHHERWLARQPFGLRRDEDYWHYKLKRENYLYQHSSLNWPQLTFISDNFGKYTGGYALLEQSGPYLRVLEVIGEERIAFSLWAQIFRLAARRNAKLIRSWAFMAPPLPAKPVLSERDWSIPMMLPLRSEIACRVEEWIKCVPPPLLELDHF